MVRIAWSEIGTGLGDTDDWFPLVCDFFHYIVSHPGPQSHMQERGVSRTGQSVVKVSLDITSDHVYEYQFTLSLSLFLSEPVLSLTVLWVVEPHLGPQRYSRFNTL